MESKRKEQIKIWLQRLWGNVHQVFSAMTTFIWTLELLNEFRGCVEILFLVVVYAIACFQSIQDKYSNRLVCPTV